jgi:hypothetical protein
MESRPGRMALVSELVRERERPEMRLERLQVRLVQRRQVLAVLLLLAP